MRQCIPWVKCRNRARKLGAKKQTNTVRGKLGFKPVHALRQMLQTALWKLAKLENMRNCKENWWCGPVHAIGQVLQGDLLLCITATLAATKTFNTLKTFVACTNLYKINTITSFYLTALHIPIQILPLHLLSLLDTKQRYKGSILGFC